MRLGSRGGTASQGTERIRQSLIVAQVALAFVLLSGAGLLGLSLQRVLNVPSGFRPDNVLTGKLSISRANFPSESAVLTFVDELRSEIGRRPGVTAVGLSTNIPLSGVSNKSAVTVKDYVRPPGESLRGHYSYSVDGDVFDALGMTLVTGRLLTAADSRRPARVAVVDEDFARHYWPDGGAMGQRIWSGSGDQPDDQAFSIVGIVKPMKQADLSERDAQGAAYFPFGHRMDGQFFVVVRTTQEPTALAATMQRVVRDLSPDLPVSDLMPLTDRVSASLIVRRSPALLAGMFSAVALLLTAIGTYGVLSYTVALRRKEIGLRIALGATPADVRGRIVARAAGLFAAGAAIGVVGAWFEGQALQAVLFDVPRFHLPTVLAATLVLGAAAVAASVLPSRRAARISPLEAMADDA
jgi:predicted permease